MTRQLEWIVSVDDAGGTVKRFLQARGFTAAVLTLLKKTEGALTVNGVPVFVTATLAEGDKIAVRLTDESDSAAPEDLRVPVVWEDEDVLVYD
ncbi:MAG: RluA family pseudouridine synthase, partial [Clostridia bacterium]|nr:RluA family pseudouridine synthase [Clostridia bacterium]